MDNKESTPKATDNERPPANQDELRRKYEEQQRRMQCAGCGEDRRVY